jgi:hypothetical protein
LFYKDNLSDLYTLDLIEHFKRGWSEEKIKIVLDIVAFLAQDQKAEANIKSLETLMDNNDVFFRELFLTL